MDDVVALAVEAALESLHCNTVCSEAFVQAFNRGFQQRGYRLTSESVGYERLHVPENCPNDVFAVLFEPAFGKWIQLIDNAGHVIKAWNLDE